MKKKIIGIIFCTLLITVVSSTAINVKNIDETNPTLILVRIDVSKDQINIPQDMEIIGNSPGNWIDIIITRDRLQELSDLGLSFEVLIWDVIAYDNLVRGSYHSLAEMESILQDISEDYPDITDLYSIGTTYEGRDIWCLEITDNPGVDEGEPGVFFMGLHHAREWPTVEICLYIADQLTSEYGSNTQITNLVNNRRIWLVTCVNPDGYYYCHDQGHDWRKNRKPYIGGIGVDLNRNYAGSSNGDPDGTWGSIPPNGVISHYPSDDLFCGPEPFSEFETQSIRDIFLENEISAAISWHTHGQLVLWPWAYTDDLAPDSIYLSEVGQGIAQEITKQSGSGYYEPTQACGLYPTTGDTIEWAYGYSHYVLGRPTFAYTIEACSSFHPTENYLDQIVAENFDGALYLLEEAKNIRDTVTPRVMPPIIDEMQVTDIDGEYTVSWEEQNPDADPNKFQLDELIGPTTYIDDAESGTDFWEIDGFSLSTNKYHSPSQSYKSGTGNYKIYTMTTVDPIPITQGMSLEFWTWYDIEYNYDYAMVEVSLDGRSFDFLDGFTGSSSNWEHKQYDLTDYVGKSIFIRLRYITDPGTEREGIYFDDISPVVKWDSITLLSDSISNKYYDVTDKDDGIYYYRVKGFNSKHSWCDFSTLEDIVVEILVNEPPDEPIINGPLDGKVGEVYDYTFSSIDLEGNQVYYYIEWGDGFIIEWDGPHESGEIVTFSHSWSSADTFTIRAKTKDIWDYESPWAELDVTMPRTKTLLNHLFQRFQQFFYLFTKFFPINLYLRR